MLFFTPTLELIENSADLSCSTNRQTLRRGKTLKCLKMKFCAHGYFCLAYQFKVLEITLDHASFHTLQDCLQLSLVPFLLLLIIITIIRVVMGWPAHVLQPQQAVDSTAQQMSLKEEQTEFMKHWHSEKKHSQNSSKQWKRVPVAPADRLGFPELWCMALVSQGAGGPVQVHSTASAVVQRHDIHIFLYWKQHYIIWQFFTIQHLKESIPVRRGSA